MMQAPEQAAASLDDRICAARSQLQRTLESHPEFERRLLQLIRLVDERDTRMAAPRAPAPVGNWRGGLRNA
ncbi:MAG: hypothetical protein WBL61_11245 [Bryobacteraceae bacterium]